MVRPSVNKGEKERRRSSRDEEAQGRERSSEKKLGKKMEGEKGGELFASTPSKENTCEPASFCNPLDKEDAEEESALKGVRRRCPGFGSFRASRQSNCGGKFCGHYAWPCAVFTRCLVQGKVVLTHVQPRSEAQELPT